MMETNTPCVPFDVFLFYHWERCDKVDHVRHRGLKEWSPIDFLPVHILQVSFGHCRPLAASQVNRRKDMNRIMSVYVLLRTVVPCLLRAKVDRHN